MDERKLELKVGALLLVAAIGTVTLLFLLGELRFGSGKRILVDFNHTGGVADGAPVRLAGVRVGRVSELQLTPARRDANGEPLPVQMELDINADIFTALHADAQFMVATQGPLGEPFIEITTGSADEPPMKEGATVRGTDPPRMDLLTSRAFKFLEAATKIIAEDPESIQSLIRSAVRMSSQAESIVQEVRPNVTQAVEDLAVAARDLRNLAATAQDSLAGPELRSLIKDASAMTKQLRQELPPITARAQKALEGAAAVAGSFTESDAEKIKQAIARYEQAGQTLNLVATRAERLLAQLEEGQGTAGKIVQDPELYEELKALVTDLKRHPWKILWKD